MELLYYIYMYIQSVYVLKLLPEEKAKGQQYFCEGSLSPGGHCYLLPLWPIRVDFFFNLGFGGGGGGGGGGGPTGVMSMNNHIYVNTL